MGGRGRGQIFCSFMIFWVKCQEAHTRFSNQIIIIICVSSNYPAKLVLNSFPASIGVSECLTECLTQKYLPEWLLCLTQKYLPERKPKAFFSAVQNKLGYAVKSIDFASTAITFCRNSPWPSSTYTSTPETRSLASAKSTSCTGNHHSPSQKAQLI